mgnify:CR=1 FL=1
MNSINRPWRHALAVCAALLLAACGGNYAGDDTPVPGGGSSGGGTLPPVASAEGRAAYAAQCQSCHGADGNGTQAAFEQDAAVLFASSHQYPFYPGTGAESERGVGNVFNVPLEAGSGTTEFRRGMERVVLPALEAFDP